MPDAASSHDRRLFARLLNGVERAGNALPDPMTLFLVGTLVVLLLSSFAAHYEWSIDKHVVETVVVDGVPTQTQVTKTVTAQNLLSRDGSFWVIDNLVKNFTGFAPLGVVLVGMLGIGVAEKTGLIGAALKLFMLATPRSLLTPAMVFLGIMSSLGLDAGYVVLPPVAAALYKSVGRSPLVGLAAVFAGVSAGFSANLVITGLDPLLAGLTQEGARISVKDYEVASSANLYFMMASTVVLTFVGWAVSSWLVEPRYRNRPAHEGGPSAVTEDDLKARQLADAERRGLIAATIVFLIAVTGVLLMMRKDGALWDAPDAKGFPRIVSAIVPLLFFGFVLPGIAYGIATRTIRNDKDVASLMGRTMADMGPYIVLAFFAAQFVACFNHSRLGEMLALVGGQWLQSADMPIWLLLSLFILLVAFGNLFIGSASAKWAFFAPVFVPMFMTGAKISPELTQAAYRVGDSATNIISPLNPYVIIILVFMQKYMPKAGLGTLMALMLPYALVFLIVWIIMLAAWVTIGIDLGPAGPLFIQSLNPGAGG
ncbi:MAG: AbgT family transporter [Phycisphaeraceae bacterium]